MKPGMTRWKVRPSKKRRPCIFWLVALTVQSLVPSARPTKLSTALGAYWGKVLQVMRPMVVSMTTVGLVGTGSGLGALAAMGASGRSAGAWAREVEASGSKARRMAVREVIEMEKSTENRLSQRGGEG